MLQYLVIVVKVPGVFQRRNGTLNKDPVHPIVLHPFEMEGDRLAVVRAEDKGRAAIRPPERGFIFFCVFVNFRPKVYFTSAGVEFTAPGIMVQAQTGAIARSVEPSLIPGHDQPLVTWERRSSAVFVPVRSG